MEKVELIVFDLFLSPSLKSVHLSIEKVEDNYSYPFNIKIIGFNISGNTILQFCFFCKSKSSAVKLHNKLRLFYKINNVYGVDFFNKKWRIN
ncbi:MAG: hypothetical protein V4538_15665 [Bacteroidota bacterium]